MLPLAPWQALGLTMLAALATLGIQLLIAASFALVRDADLPEAMAQIGVHPLSLAVAQAGGFGLAIAVAARRFGPETGYELPIPRSTRLLAFCFLVGLALQLPLSEVANAVRELDPATVQEQLRRRAALESHSLPRAIAVMIAFLLTAPFVEELLFRGFILDGLVQRYGTTRRGELSALCLSSLLFAIVHLDYASMAYALLAGLLLGALRLRTGSIWAGVLLHAGVNALPILLPPRIVAIEGFNVVHPEVLHVPLGWLFGSLALAALGLAALERWTRYRPDVTAP